jgi:hypothetical protein
MLETSTVLANATNSPDRGVNDARLIFGAVLCLFPLWDSELLLKRALLERFFLDAGLI